MKMKLNVKLFTEIIDLLVSDKVRNAFFHFSQIEPDDESKDCGCALYHAREHGIIEKGYSGGLACFYDETLGIPEEDYDFIFGEDDTERFLVHGGNFPTKEEVAQSMEDYLISVEGGHVPGVRV